MLFLLIALAIILFIGIIVGAILIIKKTQQADQADEYLEYINTTQEQLPFEFIRRGVVKLKSGIYVKIMELPGINTQLMESEEREIVREIYSSVLNSIKHPVQFYKQSRLVDIKEYIEDLKRRESVETDKLKSEGLNIYREYITDLIRENSVQTKKDYLVIPYFEENKKNRDDDPDGLKKYRKSEEGFDSSDETLAKQKEFERAYKTLLQRAKTIDGQIRRLGISPYHLKDEDLLNLFYTTYNKERSVNQSMAGVNPSDRTTMYVKGGVK